MLQAGVVKGVGGMTGEGGCDLRRIKWTKNNICTNKLVEEFS